MGDFKLLFFVLGTLAFFVNVYLSVKHPELVKSPQTVADDAPAQPVLAGDDGVDWQKWDKVATWCMWGGWGIAAGITLAMSVEKNLGFGD